MRRRLLARVIMVLCGVLLAAASAIAGAVPASAHATLITMAPADGSVLSLPPTAAVVTFDQPVTIDADSLRVFGPHGERADSGPVGYGRSDSIIEIGLRSGLGDGTYTAAWQVVSADTHPVSGAFTFSIGAPSATRVSAHALTTNTTPLLGVAFAVVRWLAFAAFALLVGGVMIVIVCWPAGVDQRAVTRLTTGALATLAAATLAALALQGPYGERLGPSSIFSPHTLRGTLGTRLGHDLEIRLILLAISAMLIAEGTLRLTGAGSRLRAVYAVTWVILAGAMAATWSTADHASVGGQVAISETADIGHLVSMAVWTGGLVILTGVLLNGRHDEAAAIAVPRFSTMALTCVTIVIGSGLYESWRNVGGFGALADTGYGRLLLVKGAGTIVLIGLGYLARRWIAHGLVGAPRVSPAPVAAPVPAAPPALDAGHGDDHPAPSTGVGTLGRLRVSVAVETAVVVGVLAASAVLVESPTGRESYRPVADVSMPFVTGAARGSGRIRAIVSPATLGPDRIRLTLTGSHGRPYPPTGLTAELALPARNLGPEPVTLSDLGAGRYASGPVEMTFTGRWRLLLTIRGDAWNETTLSVPFTIH